MNNKYLDCGSIHFWNNEIFEIAGDFLTPKYLNKIKADEVYLDSNIDFVYSQHGCKIEPTITIKKNIYNYYEGLIAYHGTKACFYDDIFKDGLRKLDEAHLLRLVNNYTEINNIRRDDIVSCIDNYEMQIRMDCLWFYYDVRMLFETATHHTSTEPEALSVLNRLLFERLKIESFKNNNILTSKPLILKCKIPFGLMDKNNIDFVSEKCLLHYLYHVKNKPDKMYVFIGGFPIHSNLQPGNIEEYIPTNEDKIIKV